MVPGMFVVQVAFASRCTTMLVVSFRCRPLL
jgi:hypothetical protein